MGFRVLQPEDLAFETRPHEPGEAPRHAAAVTEAADLRRSRANFFRFEPGARGRRHTDHVQEETYVPIAGTLTMYIGDPPARHAVATGGLINVAPGVPRQVVNEGADELLVYIHGGPPERGEVDFLDSAV